MRFHGQRNLLQSLVRHSNHLTAKEITLIKDGGHSCSRVTVASGIFLVTPFVQTHDDLCHDIPTQISCNNAILYVSRSRSAAVVLPVCFQHLPRLV